jgi:Fe-S-cluster containining protein
MAKEKRVVLPIFGENKATTVPLPGGTGGLGALLPAIRKLSSTVMTESETRARAAGLKVSCKTGCTACCHQLVPVSLIEAKALVTALARLPQKQHKEVKNRFAHVLSTLEKNGLIHPKHDQPRTSLVSPGDGSESERWDALSRRYLELNMACPFLIEGRCSVYEERPFACREYAVTSSPEHCATLSDQLAPLPRPVLMTQALSLTVDRLEDAAPSTLALPLALEWVEARGAELRSDHDLSEAFDVLFESIEWQERDGLWAD